MKKTVKPIALLTAIVMLITMFSFTAFATEKELVISDYGFVDVGDTKIEYGIYGGENEQNLVILTGNGGDMHGHDGNILPGLASKYRVLCISTRGTGKTALGDGRLTFEKEADDLKAVLDYLGIEKTYVYGFSDGGNLALVFTLRYPQYVTKLCVESPNINIFGTRAFKQMQIIWQYFILCIECLYKTDADFFRQREIKGMMANQPALKFSDLENISVPTLHIYAENDMMYRSHSKMITKSIPDCREIMIEDAQHAEALQYADEIIVPALIDFYG